MFYCTGIESVLRFTKSQFSELVLGGKNGIATSVVYVVLP